MAAGSRQIGCPEAVISEIIGNSSGNVGGPRVHDPNGTFELALKPFVTNARSPHADPHKQQLRGSD